MNAVNHVMLIDDSDDDNYIHQRVIAKNGFANRVAIYQYAEQALDFLTADRLEHPVDIIFLDINMPRMDGFEFLVTYAQLPPERRAKKLLFMVSTSLNPKDRERAESNSHVHGFIGKPLTVETLQKVLSDFGI